MLGLDDRLSRALETLRFERTTPIQSAVFSPVLAGRDLIGCAQTGTGKTAGFLLPILQRLLSGSPDGGAHHGATRVLVLAPTRELAVQIADDFEGLAYFTCLTGVAVFGGVNADAQDRALRAGVDLVVATPGRLLDHINSGAARFDALEVLVLDEADRMLDMGFWPDVRRIVSTLPSARQTLLFTATLSDDVAGLASQIMRDPKLVQVGRQTGLATRITHVAHVVGAGDKTTWLSRFLDKSVDPTLVFVRTRRAADRLSMRLASSRIRCGVLHADRTQAERTQAIERFKSGSCKVLIATDIAARGLDIDRIGHVINFDVPETADQYVHRVGRTGRAEAAGTALTLVSPEEVHDLRAIERSLNLRLVDPAPA
jgi:ATP-dependent RNA helicase RhlE